VPRAGSTKCLSKAVFGFLTNLIRDVVVFNLVEAVPAMVSQYDYCNIEYQAWQA
jgi:hypothetical protein